MIKFNNPIILTLLASSFHFTVSAQLDMKSKDITNVNDITLMVDINEMDDILVMDDIYEIDEIKSIDQINFADLENKGLWWDYNQFEIESKSTGLVFDSNDNLPFQFKDGNVAIAGPDYDLFTPSATLDVRTPGTFVANFQSSAAGSATVQIKGANPRLMFTDINGSTKAYQYYNNSMDAFLLTVNSASAVKYTATSTSNVDMAVNGEVRAKKVRVLQSPWSDFVFEKDYKLMPLADVEKHIQDNGHLPGVPSAEEVQKDGISLGDMDAKLLEKIEELTLYLIDAKKEIETLKKQVSELSK